jgi:Zn finger protein HypA/HybF involved in hydrogenase expression
LGPFIGGERVRIERISGVVAKVMERVAEHYAVQEVECGKVYKWHPQSLLIECECGEIVTLTTSETTCEECGAEHTRLVREDSKGRMLEGDEEVHPWRSEHPYYKPTRGT